ncbi:MAG: chemotaxis protein CheW [Polyangiaceae bacterium]
MSTLHILFRVADAEYVLPASDVLHMESFGGATHVPGTPPHVVGLMQIRQRLVPIVSLRARFGLPPVEATLDTRVVVVQDGQRVVGLLVDSAREIMKLGAEQFSPPPSLIAEQAAGYVTSVLQTGARLLMLIDFKKVIGEEVHHGQ